MARRERESGKRGVDAVGGTSILRRRGALRLSGDNGVDGCEASHDPSLLPPRRSRRVVASSRFLLAPFSLFPVARGILSHIIIVISNFGREQRGRYGTWIPRCVIMHSRSHCSPIAIVSPGRLNGFYYREFHYDSIWRNDGDLENS